MISTVLLYGFLSGVALVVGAIMGIYLQMPKKLVAAIMAFGSGVLISSLSIDLMTDAFETSGNILYISLGFIVGALIFVLGDYVVDSMGADNRKKAALTSDAAENSSGTAIFLGTLLDGIPESLVMGAALASGSSAGFVFVIAVFLSNLPEGISGTIAMRNSGFSTLKILMLWFGLLLLTMLFTVIGFYFLGNSSVHFNAIAMAFASGAILAMLSDCMLPEAYKEGGIFTGILVAFGFLTAFVLTNYMN